MEPGIHETSDGDTPISTPPLPASSSLTLARTVSHASRSSRLGHAACCRALRDGWSCRCSLPAQVVMWKHVWGPTNSRGSTCTLFMPSTPCKWVRTGNCRWWGWRQGACRRRTWQQMRPCRDAFELHTRCRGQHSHCARCTVHISSPSRSGAPTHSRYSRCYATCTRGPRQTLDVQRAAHVGPLMVG